MWIDPRGTKNFEPAGSIMATGITDLAGKFDPSRFGGRILLVPFSSTPPA
jgi:hypothetical protein